MTCRYALIVENSTPPTYPIYWSRDTVIAPCTRNNHEIIFVNMILRKEHDRRFMFKELNDHNELFYVITAVAKAIECIE